MQDAIAIIPARGGSKRFPRKNLIKLKGVPLFVRVAKTALESRLFKSVVVSTEDREIERIGRQEGLDVFVRNPLTASDEATVVDVCFEYFQVSTESSDRFCCIYATAALIGVRDLIDSYRLFDIHPTPDCVMGVGEYNLHPFKALGRNDEGWFEQLFPGRGNVKGQLLPDVVASNGSFYWASTDWFLVNKSFFGERMLVYKLPEERWQDVDYPEDFVRLERKLEERGTQIV